MKRFYVPSIFQELDNLHEQVFRTPTFAGFDAGSGLSVYEDAEHVVVEAALAGLSQDEIETNFEKGVLWIQGKPAVSEDDDKKKYHLKSERQYNYSLRVPGEIDAQADISAVYENGLLRVLFKKSAQDRPRKIAISHAA